MSYPVTLDNNISSLLTVERCKLNIYEYICRNNLKHEFKIGYALNLKFFESVGQL